MDCLVRGKALILFHHIHAHIYNVGHFLDEVGIADCSLISYCPDYHIVIFSCIVRALGMIIPFFRRHVVDEGRKINEDSGRFLLVGGSALVVERLSMVLF